MIILGFTDEITTCDCCGRAELKGTYVMDDNEGNIFHYGSTCGVNAAGLQSAKELNKEVKKVEISKTIESAKGDSQINKFVRNAINKGFFTEEEIFVKHGKMIGESKFELYYKLGSRTFALQK